ncbi:hypothetical protein FRB94_002618 [Tulasnella sp. JGI-2019a]|nr:hypothetical protein FRB94_002618 [Tulasnella sp. JGI-2019a]
MRIPSCKRLSVVDFEATGPTFSAATAHLTPGLSSILLAAKNVFINVGSQSLDYKAVTNADRCDESTRCICIKASGHQFTDAFALETLSWLLDNVHSPSFSLPVFLSISEILPSCELFTIIDRLSYVITYLFLALPNPAAKTIISYLAGPFEIVIDGATILRWPLPNLTELDLQWCGDLELADVLACVQRRAGRGLFLKGKREHREELPAKLLRLDPPLGFSTAELVETFPDYMEWSGLR